MGYLELDALKRTLELQGETYADDDLRTAIESASQVIEKICGRSFSEAPEEPTTREYKVRRTDLVPIDDLLEVTSIETRSNGDWTALAETEYELEPLNAEADGKPWEEVRATTCFEPPLTMRVEGRFGWAAVPVVVEEATSILSARLVKRVREAPFGIAGMGADGMAVRVSASDPDVALLLSNVTRSSRLG